MPAWISLWTLLKASLALATLWINVGTYEIPALLKPAKDGPIAVLNAGTKSECHVHLKGAPVKKLKVTKASKFEIRLKIDAFTTCRKDMDAELLEAKPLADAKIPRIVGNNFIPLNL